GVISESFEAGVRAAASIGVHHLSTGYAVTLENNSGRQCSALRIGPARTRLLDSLARAELGSNDLASAISRLLADGQRDLHPLVTTGVLSSRRSKPQPSGCPLMYARLSPPPSPRARPHWSWAGSSTAGGAGSSGC